MEARKCGKVDAEKNVSRVNRLPGYFILALPSLLAACSGSDSLTAPTAAQACSSLQGLTIPPSAIGKPTSGAVVQSAILVAATAQGNSNGEYCAVTGAIHPVDSTAPNIQFEVNLPSSWNNRVLQLGGGAYDGTLVTGLGAYPSQPAGTPNPLKQGYVTLGSDGGHTGTNGFDGSFALNNEALLNFGQLSVKKTHDVALAIIQKRYSAAPKYSYFIGGSQGGHEALDAAARYPSDFDGVIANYPAYNVTGLQLASLAIGKALYANNGTSWINPTKKKLLTDAVYAACDALDGVQDGIISNVASCDTAFNVATLRCPGGNDTGNTCLSDAQIAAATKIATPYDPGFPIAGKQIVQGWPIFEGATFNVATFGSSPTPSNPPLATDSFHFGVGAALAKYFITQNPALDAMTFDPSAWQARIQQVGNIMDVTNVSLDAFRAKGGKVMLVHGDADEFITPHNSVDYYTNQVSQLGQTQIDTFFRFYLVPGFSHGFGAYNLGYDGLAAITGWVENGHAPETLTSTDNNAGANRTRPMCRYPAWPKYTGSTAAGANDAANFTCVTS